MAPAWPAVGGLCDGDSVRRTAPYHTAERPPHGFACHEVGVASGSIADRGPDGI